MLSQLLAVNKNLMETIKTNKLHKIHSKYIETVIDITTKAYI